MNSEVDRALKRALDLAFAGGALALSWPAFLALAAVIKWEDGGSALYVQGGSAGSVALSPLQVRTMRQRSSYSRVPITVGDDDRVLGSVVFFGEHDWTSYPSYSIYFGGNSVVGPRPEVSLRCFGTAMSSSRVKPGLTDPATLAFRGEADVLGAADPEGPILRLSCRSWR